MDHLQNDDERKARWYARGLEPRYLSVVTDHNLTCANGGRSSGAVRGIPAQYFLNGDGDATLSIQAHPFSSAAASALGSDLRTHGFAVIKGALTLDECDEALGLAWDYVEVASGAERWLQQHQKQAGDIGDIDALCNIGKVGNEVTTLPVRRDDASSHSSLYFPRSVEGGILPFYGSGHSTFGWFVRSRPSVQAAFAAVHGISVDDLITSLDGMVLWRDGVKG